ncbi:MAG: hypothetical protein AAB497_03090 [Patescibacteria group bacterium]
MKTKNIAPILAGLFIALGAGVLIAHGAEINYAPLAPLPIGDAGAIPANYTLSSYLSGMIKLLIALGAVTAILFAIIGGTQYVAAGIAPSAKKEAKDRIMNALIGLTIMLTSYLLLNSINPDLVNFNLELKSVATTTVKALGELNKWPDDTVIREELQHTNILLNKDNCVNMDATPSKKSITGGSGCTSVAGLPRQAIDGLLALKHECGGLSCPTTITGGTELGHQTHGVGIPNVDLRPNTELDNFIKSKARAKDPIITGASCGVSTAPHYYLLNVSYTGVYVLEPEKNGQPEHWHICFS